MQWGTRSYSVRVVTSVALVSFLALARTGSAAVSKKQLLAMVEQKVDSVLILQLIQRDCVDFSVTPEVVIELSPIVPKEILQAVIACRSHTPPSPRVPEQSTAFLGRSQQWASMGRDIVELLRRGQFRLADKRASELGREMIDRGAEGEKLAEGLAVVMAYRAAANAGQKRTLEAEWFWSCSTALRPGIEKANLNPVVAALLTSPAPAGQIIYNARKVPPASSQPAGIQPPQVLHKEQPYYPRNDSWPATIFVESVIGKDGRPRYARFLGEAERAPVAMKYSALEALGAWRFKPATLDGRPVNVYFTLTVNFHRRSSG